MRFSSNSQRKAVFANINKFAAAPIDIEGYTGSSVIAYPGDNVDWRGNPVELRPTVHVSGEPSYSPVIKGDTVILAGEDYKRGILEKLAKEKAGIDYQHIQLAEPENRELVSTIAGAERFVGMPVYSIPAKKELIPGGLSSGRPDSDFDPEQIAMGIEVEKEHVIKFTDKGNVRKFKDSDLEKAKEITKDHLAEIPDYYSRLEQLEEGAKEEGVFIDVIEQKKETSGEFSRASDELKVGGRFVGIRNNMEIWVKDGKEFGITPGKKVIDLSYLH